MLPIIKRGLSSWRSIRHRVLPAEGVFFRASKNQWWVVWHVLTTAIVVGITMLAAKRLAPLDAIVSGYNPYFKADRLSDSGFWVQILASQVLIAIMMYLAVRYWYPRNTSVASLVQAVSIIQSILMLLGVLFIFSINISFL